MSDNKSAAPLGPADALLRQAIALFNAHFDNDAYWNKTPRKQARKSSGKTPAKNDPSGLHAASAPGRVNLIGEHTDYNDGFVLPMAIDRRTVVVGRFSGLPKYRFVSVNAPKPLDSEPSATVDPAASGSGSGSGNGVSNENEVDAADAVDAVKVEHKGPGPRVTGKRPRGSQKAKEEGAEPVVLEFSPAKLLKKPKPPTPDGKPGTPITWDSYVRGVVAGYKAQGHDILPFDLAIVGNVPLGGGLASSASLEVAVATLLESMLSIKTISPVDKARICQQAEHQFCLVPCGIMDQMVASCAVPGFAMLIDCRTQEQRNVKLDDPTVSFIITNSGVRHQLAGGEYAQRRLQCEAAVYAMQSAGLKNVIALRDASPNDLARVASSLDPLCVKRARHVITEDIRTTQAVQLLEARRYAEVGKLMQLSHESLRDDYEVSCKELDTLCEIACEAKGVYGSRMTGGGFGGCTVTLVATEELENVCKYIKEEYLKRTGREATILVSRPSGGAAIHSVPLE